MTMRKVKLHNPKKFEVLLTQGTIKGSSRKIVVVACYVPPNYTIPRAREALDFISGVVSHAKSTLGDPLVIVAGDFNQWKIQETLEDFPDLEEHDVGNTRGDHSIDRIFSNLKVSVSGNGRCGRAF